MATLRQIIEKLGEEWMDAEFSFRVYDGHRNSEQGVVSADWHQFFRHHGGPEGKDMYLRIDLGLDKYRLVKERSRT